MNFKIWNGSIHILRTDQAQIREQLTALCDNVFLRRVWFGGGGGGCPDPASPLLFHENPASRTALFRHNPESRFLPQKNTLKSLISTKAYK